MSPKCFFLTAIAAAFAVAGAGAADLRISPQQAAFFEARIRPVLAEKCYSCHSAGAAKIGGRLLLDTREGARRGGANGPAVVPGDLMASLLISAIRWHEPERGMPPQDKGGKLPAAVIASLEQWILMGAPDPRVKPAAPAQIIHASAPIAPPRQSTAVAPAPTRLPVAAPPVRRDLIRR